MGILEMSIAICYNADRQKDVNILIAFTSFLYLSGGGSFLIITQYVY